MKSSPKLLLFLLGSPAFAATLLKVACGGPGGAGWVPDTPYVTGGSTQAVAGAQALPYNFLRYAPPSSSIQYSFSVSGVTSVTLFFIEPRAAQAVGQRVFSVALNGATILTNLDLFAVAGALTPKSYTFPVASSPSGALTIAFSAATGNAVVSGIQLDGAEQPKPQTYVKGLETDRPPCPGIVDFYGTTDTSRLFWCSPGGWLPIQTAPVALNDPWPMGFHDPQHTGTSAEALKPPLSVAWTWKDAVPYDNGIGQGNIQLFPAAASWFPIYSSGKLYLQGGNNANRLFALDAATGKDLWRSDNPGYASNGSQLYQFSNYPALVAGRVVYASTDFTASLDASTGGDYHNLYNTNGGWPAGGVAVDSGLAYEKFLATDSSTDALAVVQPLNLSFPTTKQFVGPDSARIMYFMSGLLSVPAVDQGVVYANVAGMLSAWKTDTQGLIWNWGKDNTDSSPAVSSGTVYFCAYLKNQNLYLGTGRLVALKYATGTSPDEVWSVPFPGCTSPIVSGGLVYVGSTDQSEPGGSFARTVPPDHNFYALDAATGAVKWTFTTGRGFLGASIPAISGDLIYVPGADGILYALNKKSGVEAWRFVNPTLDIAGFPVAWGPVAIGDGMIYVSDFKSTIYTFRSSLSAQANPGCIPNDGLVAQSRFTVDCYECLSIRDLGTAGGKPRIVVMGADTLRQYRVEGDAPGECRAFARLLVDQVPGLFDSAPGLFDAR